MTRVFGTICNTRRMKEPLEITDMASWKLAKAILESIYDDLPTDDQYGTL